MFTAEHQQALMTFPFQNLHFFSDLIDRQRDTIEFFIVAPKPNTDSCWRRDWQHKEEQTKPAGCRKYLLYLMRVCQIIDQFIVFRLEQHRNFFRRGPSSSLALAIISRTVSGAGFFALSKMFSIFVSSIKSLII